MRKTILILYAKSGCLGHEIIANNYANLFKAHGYEVTIADVYEIDSSTGVEAGKKIYYWLLRELPWVWRWLYSHWSLMPGANWFRMSVLPRRFKRSQERILKEKADVVITTHPTATSIVNYLKANRKTDSKLFTVFSDWHTQKFWVFPCVDRYLVVTAQQKLDLAQLGFGDNQVVVTGILLGDNYYNAPSKKDARNRLNLSSSIPVILVMGGGKGLGIDNVARSLLNLKKNVRIIIIGATEERKKDIEQLLSSSPKDTRHFEVTGFIEPSLYFAAADLIITKPGGLTIAQAFLLKLPVLSTAPVPGQEDQNLSILFSQEAVLRVEGDITLAAYVDNLVVDKDKLEHLITTAHNLAPLHARERVLSIIKSEIYNYN
jgi:processive 1,2-diacylglycerol beta-glucosyltransferase